MRSVPSEIEARITTAGGLNRLGEPLFRVVWGADRVTPNHGEWHGMKVKVDKDREVFLDTNIVETRMEPKYLPVECWHLECWCAPETYGTPDTWGKLGSEVVGEMTIDTAGPFPERGEYELCYPLTDNLAPDGKPMTLNGKIVELLVNAIRLSRLDAAKTNHIQRMSAIRQRMERERQMRIAETADMLLDARPAFYDQPTSFRSGPKNHKIQGGESKLWIPEHYRN